jgi:hypothetical protein
VEIFKDFGWQPQPSASLWLAFNRLASFSCGVTPSRMHLVHVLYMREMGSNLQDFAN